MTDMKNRILTATGTLGALALALALAPVNAGQGIQYRFTPGSGNGGCWVDFPGPNLPGSDTPTQVRFSVRVRDGNFGASILVNGWKKAQEMASSEANFPMTVTFDTGKTTTSRSGGYESGFNDSAWAGWGAGPASDAALAMLKGAKTARIKFDGKDFGAVDFQMKGLAHAAIIDCVEKTKAGA
jgi:hypothetical protein